MPGVTAVSLAMIQKFLAQLTMMLLWSNDMHTFLRNITWLNVTLEGLTFITIFATFTYIHQPILTIDFVLFSHD